MSDWTDAPQSAVVSRLTALTPEARAQLRQGPFDKPGHDRLFDSLSLLRQIECGGAAARRDGVKGPARVLFWNTERLRHIGAIGGILRENASDVMLLCEIDRGMARSGNGDRIVEIATDLKVGYAFAVEYVELDLGDIHEQRDHAGEVNREGLHGAACLSAVTMHQPFLIRIDRRGDWFGEARQEPRIGGTIAIGCTVIVAGVPVIMVNVHLESHDDPAARAGDMRRLLEQIESLSQGGPVILGGDFNTSTTDHAERTGAGWRDKISADPMRVLRPQPFEPLFGVAAGFGYDWSACNLPDQATTRHPPGSLRLASKIDWFFARGLLVRDPAILPAVQADGIPASDHDALIVSIVPLP